MLQQHVLGEWRVSLPHLNQLEIEVVSLLDYNLLVTASSLEAARKRLLDSS